MPAPARAEKERICAKCGTPFKTLVWKAGKQEVGAIWCEPCRVLGRLERARESEERQREVEAKEAVMAERIAKRDREMAEQERRRRAEAMEEARELRLEESGLMGMEGMTFSSIRARPEVKELGIAAECLQGLIPSCFETDSGVHMVSLLGKCGLGKTMLAVAAGQKALEHDTWVRFYRVPSMVSALNSALLKDRNEYDRLWARLYSISLLVLDDFGTEKWTENTLAYLDSLIATRHQDNAYLLTIVTSNLTLKQMPERIASRLQDKAVSRVFFLAGPDYRLIPGRVQLKETR